MADNIIKLRVDSNEYESKIKRASQGITDLANSLRNSKKSFAEVDKEQLQYIQALGKMETVTKDARGSVKELTGAYIQLSAEYNKLSQAEKDAASGQALAKSLEELKQRVQDGKKELEDINRELNATSNEGQETGGVMKQLADRFTVNIDAMKLFDIGLSAVKGALDVVKDAFFNNEEQLDAWGREVKTGENLYKGFLNALNTGDISGYLSNIDEIIKAARDAYNALDNLSTFNAFNQINNAAGRTDLQNAINDFRAQGGKGDRSRVLAAAAVYKQNLTDRQKLERAAYEAEVAVYARDRGINPQDLLDALSGSWGNYQTLKALPMTGRRTKIVGTGGSMTGGGPTFINTTEAYAANEAERLGQALRSLNDTELQYLQGLGAAAQQTGYEIAGVDRQLTRVLRPQTTTTPTTPRGGGRGSGSVTQQIKVEATESLTELQLLEDQLKTVENSMSGYGKGTDEWKAMNEEAERLRELIKELNGETKTFIEGFSIQNTQGLSAYISMIKQQLDQADFGSALYDSLSQSLVDTTTLQTLVEQSLKAGLGTALFDVADDTGADFWTRAMEGGVDNVDWQSIVDKINEKLQSIGYEPIKIDFETGNIANVGKQTENSWKAAANAVQSVGSALQQIDDPGAKIVGLIGQAIANIALGFAQATAASSGAGIFGWIAAIAGGLATMTSTIAAIHSATGYAEGGIVKGTTFSGDQIPADSFVNAGELILNRSQQNSIASQLQEASRGGSNGIARVSGEQIYIAMNAYLRRSGKGELVTWK